jgi:superoxide reductase
MDKLYVCNKCGYIAFGNAPDECPVCDAPKTAFLEKPDAIRPSEKEGKEKHVPVITVTESCGLIPGECRDVHIQVGSVPHPMQEDHWIMSVDVYVNRIFSARYMMAPQSLQAAVGIHMKKDQTGTLTVIEHCNKHGNWMAEAQL